MNTLTMIRVEREEQAVGGKWRWHAEVPSSGARLEGLSRQPLLDACRALERMGADPATQCGLFRAGRSDWDLRTTVGHGASVTVFEEPRLRFGRFKPFERPSRLLEAAE